MVIELYLLRAYLNQKQQLVNKARFGYTQSLQRKT